MENANVLTGLYDTQGDPTDLMTSYIIPNEVNISSFSCLSIGPINCGVIKVSCLLFELGKWRKTNVLSYQPLK